MTRGVKSQMGSRNVVRQLGRFTPFACLFALAACNSLLGIEELHEGPAPGSGGSGDNGGGSGTGGRSGSGNGGDATIKGGSSSMAGTSGRGHGGNANAGASAAGAAGDTTGDAGAAGAAGAPTTGSAVHGHVIDFWGHKLSGVPVEINGTMVPTDDLGAFTINDVPEEYDASLVVEFPDNYDGQIYGWVYQGLTRRDPTLQVYSGLERQSGNVSITPTHADVTLTTGRTQSVSFGGPDGNWDFTDVSAQGYGQTSVGWRGPPMTQQTVHGLIFSQDPTSNLPTGYAAYDAKPIALNGAVSDISPVTLDMSAKTIVSGNITGTVTPAGFDTRANHVFLQFTSNAFIQLVEDSGPNTFTYQVPTIAESTVTFTASEGQSDYGAFAVAHQDALAAGATGVAVTIPKPSTHLALIPATAVNKVDANTQFSFQAGAGSSGLFVIRFDDADSSSAKTDGLFIVTAKKSLKLPKVANDTFALIPATSYYWRVETHGALANADAAAGPGGFMDPFSGDYYHITPGGPRRGSGSFTTSDYSAKITMAP